MDEDRFPLPRYVRVLDFLAEREVQTLFDWALATADRFQPATVSRAQPRVDRARRIALTSAQLGPLEATLRTRLLDLLPELMAGTGTIGPRPTFLELELAAHGDGAYYRPHMDLRIGDGLSTKLKAAGVRVLSTVFYFHANPQKFSGGQLRLFRFGAIPQAQEPQPAPHIDLEPLRNSIVAFPSWVPHEVRPIAVPTGQFADYRFALNCWFCRPSGR